MNDIPILPKYLFDFKDTDGLLEATFTDCHFDNLNINKSATFGIKSVDGKNVYIRMHGVAIIPIVEYERLKSIKPSIIGVIESFMQAFVVGLTQPYKR